MKRRTAVRIISYLSAAVLVFGVLGRVQYVRAETYRRQAENGYQRAFSELCASMTALDASLQKSVYAVSPAITSALCTEIYGEIVSARMSLGVLPFSTQEMENTAGFLSRVGDYADAMARKAAAGGNTEEERENLRSLSETAVLLAQNLTDMQTELTDGRLRMDELQDANRRIEESGEQASATVGDGFLQMEQEFPELPSLIYDGPFSEHLENVSPKLLEGSAEIDEDLAKQTAAAFLGLPITAMGSGEHCAGTIPCRRFCAGQYCVTVSDRGGEVLEAICSRRPESAALSAEEGVAAARRLLEGWGYKNMAESYHLIQDNVLTVNFAWQRNGVLFYPDLVKVGVALDDGSLMSFDAMGYVAFHCERELPAVQVSSEDARGQVGGELEILAEELAVIPSGGEYETLCYEFKCADQEGRHYIFYVNADTGQQEKILILLEDESGALTL